MIEHWYEYQPAAWFIPEGRWYVAFSVVRSSRNMAPLQYP